jgi:replicative DNA helicase
VRRCDIEVVGCLTASTRIRLAGADAAEVPVGHLAMGGGGGLPVWTVDARGRLTTALMAKAFFTGVRTTFALGLLSGRIVEATANHPFLTTDGWLRVDELTLGDRIASAEGRDGEPELGWDIVTLVEALGPRPVYDVSIPATHNFLANGVVAHNSTPPAARSR